MRGFLSPVDLQISQPYKFFQPSRQKTPLFLNGLTWLWFRICYVFSTPFLFQNASQWNNSSQASTRSFNVVPRSEHQKRKPENHSMWVWFFLVLKRSQTKEQDSKVFIMLFYSQKRFLADLRSSKLLVNYRSRSCVSERTGSLWCFESFFFFFS